jgi:hypothetical protein
MSIETLLLSVAVKNWRTQHAVVFDWHDGPKQGVCSLATPECEFVFDLVAERFNPDGLDDKLFRLREVPKGTIAKILSLVSSLGPQAIPVWAPVWSFANASERTSADNAIDEILNSSRHTSILIRTQDMVTFLGCWKVDAIPPAGKDWFDNLGL